MKTVSLVLTSPLVRSSLQQLLAKAGYSVIGEASDIAGAVEPGDRQADLVIVDAALCTDDIGVLTSLRQHTGDRITVLGHSDQLRRLPANLIMAADGVLSLDVSCEALHRSLAIIATGERVMPHWLLQSVMMPASPISAESVEGWPAPSRREAEMLCLLAKGLSNKLIARELAISEATVKVHLKHLFQKLRFTNRTQAALWAHENLKGHEVPQPPIASTGRPYPASAAQAVRKAFDRPAPESRARDMAALPVPDYGQSRMIPATNQR
jgi:two-component system nitrate/nitrite response regulator NarL